MDKYENLGLVGEGSYGMVLKCRHKETGQMVAIKKFLESDEDKLIRKIAMREVKMLQQLHHDNLVNLIETFYRRKRLYLVFEFVDHTVLDELEKYPKGLDETTCRKIMWQVLKGIEFCHIHNIIHRDIKPENILVSKMGIIKICDFGFARTLAQPGEAYTDYVATRWYRAPELLVGDTKYGRAVDIWAIGCLSAEILTGEPLFPGDSDIDQLYHIITCFGDLTARHREVYQRNPLFVGVKYPVVQNIVPLEKRFPQLSPESISFFKQSLQLDPDKRFTCSELLKHAFFLMDGFALKFVVELKKKIQYDNMENPLNRACKEIKIDANDNDGNSNQSNRGLGRGVLKEKKKSEAKVSKDDLRNSEDKLKKKIAETENCCKVSSTFSMPKAGFTTFVNNSGGQMVGNPAAGNGTGCISTSAEGELLTGCDTPQHQTTSNSIPPIKNMLNLQARPSVSKLKSEDRWSPQNTLMIGNGIFSSRANDKIVKRVGKKNTPAPYYHHSITISPQPVTSEKSFLHDKSLQKQRYKLVRVGDKLQEDRPSLSLPEVRGTDLYNKLKEKQPGAYKKSSVSSIPHITNLDLFTAPSSSQQQLDSHPANDKDLANTELPNV